MPLLGYLGDFSTRSNEKLYHAKRTGTLSALALDGSEDHLIGQEAKIYWDRLDMANKRQRVIHDVEVEFNAGRKRKWDAIPYQGAHCSLRTPSLATWMTQHGSTTG